MRTAIIAATAALIISGCAHQGSPSLARSENPVAAEERTPVPVIIEQRQPEKAVPSEPKDLWHIVNGGLTFALQVEDDKVDNYLEWYGGNQRYFDRTLERARHYLPYVVARIEESGLPMELALLPFVESGYNPFAYSHSHAAGLWQFIPATGREYGLRQDWWYEGRRDIVDSTDAALRYLAFLNDYFDGDWLLALAAYNSGPGNVRRAIARNERRGKATDFWSLSLPRETRAYVPQLIALSKILNAPEKYAIERPGISPAPAFAVVELDEPIDLAQAARLAGIDARQIYQLNPGFNRWVTPPAGPHRLLLPTDKERTFREKLAETPVEQWRPIARYRVKRGDTLGAVARRHRVSVAELRKLNDLSGSMIRVGQSLRIPGTGIAAAPPFLDRVPVHYRVKSGDSLWSIARAFNTSVGALRQNNGLGRNAVIRPGQRLLVHAGRKAGGGEVAYQVKKGDSLYEIAQRFKVEVRDILAWNDMDLNNYIHPGQSLKLYPSGN